jgi:hypothetical protein
MKPDLIVIDPWGRGSNRRLVAKLRKEYPGVPIQEIQPGKRLHIGKAKTIGVRPGCPMGLLALELRRAE